MKLKTPYVAFLLLFTVLGVYYPMIFAGYNSVDDANMARSIFGQDRFNMHEIFLPGGSGYYYRPLLYLTFIADKYLFGLEESFMHLDNILLHGLNTLLVFFIALRIYRKNGVESALLPFVASLLFALHPINTEAVNWISGRTDLLACSFVLLSLMFLLAALEKNNVYLCLASSCTFLLGCLAKEVAVLFIPAAVYLIYVYDGNTSSPFIVRLKARFKYYGISVIAFASYFILRHFAFEKGDSGIATATASVLKDDVNFFNTLRITLKVYGFYFKKLFLPWPLNFGIDTISDSYVLFGIILIALCLYLLLRRRDIIAALFITSVCIISPAILVALGGMAWTRIAERYLYIPSATFAVAITYIGYAAFKGENRQNLLYGIVPLIFLVLVCTTINRNIIWQDNLTLFQDTVEKSPNFLPAKNELAIALIAHGKTKEGYDILKSNYVPQNVKNYQIGYLNRAKVLAAEGNLEGARKLLISNLDEKRKNYEEVLEQLITTNEKRLNNTNEKNARTVIFAEMIDSLKKLYTRNSDPMYLYRIGKTYMFMGNKDDAQVYFAMAYEAAPKEAFYRMPAKKLSENLGTK
jgi:tetratricopeptide (TPR) repeat protein